MVKNYEKRVKGSNLFIEIADILFIMVLCFGTLLSAMILKGKATVEMDYSINWFSASLVVIGLLVYFYMVLKQSKKELKEMINQLNEENERLNKEVV